MARLSLASPRWAWRAAPVLLVLPLLVLPLLVLPLLVLPLLVLPLLVRPALGAVRLRAWVS